MSNVEVEFLPLVFSLIALLKIVYRKNRDVTTAAPTVMNAAVFVSIRRDERA